MTLAHDLYVADMLRQQETAAGVLTQDEIRTRWHRRRVFAERAASGVTDGDAQALIDTGHGDPAAVLDDATSLTNATAVTAALAVLVADGATPSQAHVTTLASAYEVYKGADLNQRHYTKSDRTTWEAALATLVADAGSPTEGHVTDAAALWPFDVV